jgi:tetratricopeptide (TPR) repeat protein
MLRRALVLCALALPCACAVGYAQDFSELLEPPSGLEASEEELEAFYSLLSGKLIRARELSQKILQKEPKSFAAHYVMGEVEHDAEANFPRAVYHLEQARGLFEQKFGPTPNETQPWRWHTRILLSLSNAYGEIEQHDKKLALLARYNELYEPDHLAERAWPLMKLRKFDEARRAAAEGLATDDPRQREIALNALCAIEFEAGRDDASYDACKRAMENARSLGTDQDPADLMNFAEASRSVFKLDEAERIDSEATEVAHAYYGNPWSELAELYLREGRLTEALSALREIASYRAARPPSVRESDRNENRRALSAFFVVLGRPDDALRVTAKGLVAPDRRGHNSRDPLQDRTVSALLDRSAHHLKAERLSEQAAALPLHLRLKARASALVEQAESWLSGRRAVRAVSEEGRLAGSFQIGTARSAVMPPWLAGDLVHVVGAGASQSAIKLARADDRRTAAPAYYDAFEGEAALAGGDEDDAERLLKRADQTLPAAEQLLRARTLALLAALHERRGARNEALRHYERAMQIDPGVLRRLSLSLPVSLRGVSEAVGEAFADGLSRSPRFDVGERGLSVVVRADRARAQACLVGVSGAQLACGQAEAKSNEDADALAVKLLHEFHERVFAPPIDLSQVDANSLDGSTLRGSEQDLSPLLSNEGLDE